MSKQEMTCPHQIPVSQCEEHYAELQAMTNQPPSSDQDKLLEFVNNTDNISKAAKRSMEKRSAMLAPSSEALELWESIFGKSTSAKGNTEGYIEYRDFTKFVDEYVEERERVAMLDELQRWAVPKNDLQFIYASPCNICGINYKKLYDMQQERIAELQTKEGK